MVNTCVPTGQVPLPTRSLATRDGRLDEKVIGRPGRGVLSVVQMLHWRCPAPCPSRVGRERAVRFPGNAPLAAAPSQ
jgi:hypothetical protein